MTCASFLPVLLGKEMSRLNQSARFVRSPFNETCNHRENVALHRDQTRFFDSNHRAAVIQALKVDIRRLRSFGSSFCRSCV